MARACSLVARQFVYVLLTFSLRSSVTPPHNMGAKCSGQAYEDLGAARDRGEAMQQLASRAATFASEHKDKPDGAIQEEAIRFARAEVVAVRTLLNERRERKLPWTEECTDLLVFVQSLLGVANDFEYARFAHVAAKGTLLACRSAYEATAMLRKAAAAAAGGGGGGGGVDLAGLWANHVAQGKSPLSFLVHDLGADTKLPAFATHIAIEVVLFAYAAAVEVVLSNGASEKDRQMAAQVIIEVLKVKQPSTNAAAAWTCTVLLDSGLSSDSLRFVASLIAKQHGGGGLGWRSGVYLKAVKKSDFNDTARQQETHKSHCGRKDKTKDGGLCPFLWARLVFMVMLKPGATGLGKGTASMEAEDQIKARWGGQWSREVFSFWYHADCSILLVWVVETVAHRLARDIVAEMEGVELHGTGSGADQITKVGHSEYLLVKSSDEERKLTWEQYKEVVDKMDLEIGKLCTEYGFTKVVEEHEFNQTAAGKVEAAATAAAEAAEVEA